MFDERNDYVEDSFVENSIIEEVDESSESEIEEVEPTIGVVFNCKRLNIRKEANKGSEVLCEVNEGAELLIMMEESTAEWYKVCTETGMEGFCMTNYVTTN